jgi:polysaccharide deacetylase family protein (PEP-CTERM system associated)
MATSLPERLRAQEASFAPPMDPTLPRHALTVDVEDWYQSCIDYDAPITERVVRNVDRTLAVLDRFGAKATFFVQGMVAETFPRLVSSLSAAGHEVQSHGYSHRPLSSMNRAELREELERGKKTVEDAAGMQVTAFRAPDFSIGMSNLWALETLADVGFEIDSSIFPMRSRHYGIDNWHIEPHHLAFDGIVRLLEVPVAIWPLGRLRIPVAGGGYLRLFPWRLIERGLRAIDAKGRPAILYFHPYEFSAEELAEYPAVPRRIRVSQGFGRKAMADRVGALLSAFKFGRMDDVLASWGLT